MSLPFLSLATHRSDRSDPNVSRAGGRLSPILVVLVLLSTLFVVKPAEALSRDLTANALRATVQIIVPDNDFENFSLGSGTIMNNEGLVLTNYHVVAEDAGGSRLFNDDGLVGIAITPPDLRGESILKYFGVVVKTDPALDLALVQIVSLADDPDAPLPANLGLLPIEYGNSDDLMISDEINMFGYPGLGGNTPTYTRGIVAGFLDEDRDGIYEWIKTDAELNYGNSGGLATDDQGRFIGVPTAGNRDQMGKIGLVRSGNIALNFVRSYFPQQQGAGPSVSNVRFAEAVNRRNQAINPAVTFASGLSDLYAVFDFSNFQDGRSLTYIWYLDGLVYVQESFPWDSGASGTSWVSLYDEEALDDGFVELELRFDGQSLYRGGVTIGDVAPVSNQNLGAASFGPIVFSANEAGTNTGTSFSNLEVIYGFFDYTGMANGTEWVTRWYYNNQLVLETPDVWQDGPSGNFYVSLSHPDGLPAGEYRLELYIRNSLASQGGFRIQASSQPPVARGVSVIGTVTEVDNSRQRISGALIVILDPAYTVDDWIDEDFPDYMVHATGSSNRRGDYQLDAPVMPGQSYSVVVVHDDYQPIVADGYQIPVDATDPYELEVTMQRK
jgi:serine protease Do